MISYLIFTLLNLYSFAKKGDTQLAFYEWDDFMKKMPASDEVYDFVCSNVRDNQLHLPLMQTQLFKHIDLNLESSALFNLNEIQSYDETINHEQFFDVNCHVNITNLQTTIATPFVRWSNRGNSILQFPPRSALDDDENRSLEEIQKAKALLPKTKDEYMKFTIRELQFYCNERHIKGISNMNKQLVVNKLLDYDKTFHRTMSEELGVDINIAKVDDILMNVDNVSNDGDI
jgi:hypothetical protein